MNELQTTQQSNLIVQHGDDLQVSAFAPQEMQDANHALIQWCNRKIAQLKAEAIELTESFKQAVEKKWKSSTLKRHADLAVRRVTFYEKVKAALEAGFYIVPNFPVTCFAIRTDKSRPLKMMSTSSWSNREQKSQTLPAGEGDYKNPFPVQFERDVSSSDDKAKNKVVKQYWAEKFDEFEFPIQMAKPQIMQATTRAMALKLFDDFGVLPGHTKADPIIVGRFKDPRSTHYSQRFVTFIIAWHLDTRTI